MVSVPWASQKNVQRQQSWTEVCQKKQKEFHVERLRRNLSHEYREDWASWRKKLVGIMEADAFELFIAVTTVVNVAVVVWETDSAADCAGAGELACNTPGFQEFNGALLGGYMLEIFLRMLVFRSDFFYSSWNMFDLVIVAGSIVEFGLRLLGPVLPNMQVLRMFRAIRLLRTVKVFDYFPELYLMVKGLASAFAAMFWGFILIVATIGMWAIIAVELVHPHNISVDHDGNEFCENALSSVLMASLLLFQTLVAGDSWGECVIPIIRAHPATAIIFVGALVCIQLGFINLVLCVIVDRAAASREADKALQARRQKEKEEHAKDVLLANFKNIDKDHNGTMSIEEFTRGFDRFQDVQQMFELLRVEKHNLDEIFRTMDRDKSGTVDVEEFTEFVSQLHGEDERVQTLLLKMQTNTLLAKVEQIHNAFYPRSSYSSREAPSAQEEKLGAHRGATPDDNMLAATPTPDEPRSHANSKYEPSLKSTAAFGARLAPGAGQELQSNPVVPNPSDNVLVPGSSSLGLSALHCGDDIVNHLSYDSVGESHSAYFGAEPRVVMYRVLPSSEVQQESKITEPGNCDAAGTFAEHGRRLRAIVEKFQEAFGSEVRGLISSIEFVATALGRTQQCAAHLDPAQASTRCAL